MRKSFLLITILFLPLLALAQNSDDKPKAEIFGGYSYLGSNVSFPGGWEIQGTGYIKHNFGVTADFSGHYSSDAPLPGLGTSTHERIYTYLFGPSYTVRSGKQAFFAHALLGGAHGSTNFTVPATITFFPPTVVAQPFKQSSSAFAMAIGGGVDLGVTKHVAVRVGQIDWLWTHFKYGDALLYGVGDTTAQNHQSSFRYSGGIVFRF